MYRTIVVGTRRSALALRQTESIVAALRAAVPGVAVDVVHVVTRGDLSQSRDVPLPPSGLKGLFTAELEEGLLEGRIDFAVHSMKDLPTRLDPRFVIGAVPPRADPRDVLVSRSGAGLLALPPGSVVGTSSVRRAAQILVVRPDLVVRPMRGNVDTRVRKLGPADSLFDAIVLARAGLERLGMTDAVAEVVPVEVMLPAAGQGALAVQCRADDAGLLRMLSDAVHHPASAVEVEAERAFVDELGAACDTPVAALAEWAGEGVLKLTARCFTGPVDYFTGRRGAGPGVIETSGERPAAEADALGRSLAREALGRGFVTERPAGAAG